MGQEIIKRKFSQHILGIKKALIFLVSIYLLLAFLLGSSINESVTEFLLVILVPLLLIVGILYLMYAEHNRLIAALERSSVLDFLNKLKFEVKERNTGWDYQLDIQGNLADYQVAIVISKEKGIFWYKYYLNLMGRPKNHLKETVYEDPIRLTPTNETKLKLEDGLKKLLQQLQRQ